MVVVLAEVPQVDDQNRWWHSERLCTLCTVFKSVSGRKHSTRRHLTVCCSVHFDPLPLLSLSPALWSQSFIVATWLAVSVSLLSSFSFSLRRHHDALSLSYR